MSTSTTTTLTLSVEGKCLSDFLKDLAYEGSWNCLHETICDSLGKSFEEGLESTRSFIEGNWALQGDTKLPEGITTYTTEPYTEEQLDERLSTALLTATSELGWSTEERLNVVELYEHWLTMDDESSRLYQDLKVFFSVYPDPEVLAGMMIRRRLKHYFSACVLYTDPTHLLNLQQDGAIRNGVWLPNGWYMEIPYEQHDDVLEGLLEGGFVRGPNYKFENTDVITLTFNKLQAKSLHNLDLVQWGGNPDNLTLPTKPQMNALWQNACNEPLSRYGAGSPVGHDLIYGWAYGQARGAKYGVLDFLRNFDQPHNNDYLIPEFSLSVDALLEAGIAPEEMIVRSSPVKSLPGLLDSYPIADLPLQEVHERMTEDWERVCLAYPKRTKDQDTSWFYQRMVSGTIGVAEYDDKGMSYAAANEANTIVQGGEGAVVLTQLQEVKLKRILSRWYTSMSRSYTLQLEFAFDEDGQLYVLQLRALDNLGLSSGNYTPQPNDILLGTHLTRYISLPKSLTPADVLFVNPDDPSDTVREDNCVYVAYTGKAQFAHALALAQALGKSCCYAADPNITLPAEFGIRVASNGYVYAQPYED